MILGEIFVKRFGQFLEWKLTRTQSPSHQEGSFHESSSSSSIDTLRARKILITNFDIHSALKMMAALLPN